jgi:hypothetical protein
MGYPVDRKLLLHNLTSRTTPNFGSVTWILNQEEAQKLESAQMCLLRPLLDLTTLDQQRNSEVREGLKIVNIFEECKSNNEVRKLFGRNGKRQSSTSIPLPTEESTELGTTRTTMEMS